MKHDISWMILGVLQETATCRFQEKQVTKKKGHDEQARNLPLQMMFTFVHFVVFLCEDFVLY
jgi:hypothetical protein